MKKLAQILVAVFVVSIVMSACKSHETCPAYSKADVEETQTNI